MLIGFFTEYYTSDSYKPTQKLSESSKTGSATIIIDGIALGMNSTAIPVVIVGISILVSFFAAGGGGFLVFYVQPERQDAVRWAMRDLLYIPFKFEDGGTRVIHYTPEDYTPKD